MSSRISIETIRSLQARAGLSRVPDPFLIVLGFVVVIIFALVIARVVFRPSAEFDVSRVGGETTTGVDAGQPSAAAPEAGREATSVVVHVVGAVRHPGVFELAAGSRVLEAVEAAGGLMPNAASAAQNLARLLVDGEQILVLTCDEWEAGNRGQSNVNGPAGPGSAVEAGSSGIPVDLNTASATELEALPGIGPSTAQKIVTDREANGSFATPEDLMRVPGIGPKKYEALKDLVMVR